MKRLPCVEPASSRCCRGRLPLIDTHPCSWSAAVHVMGALDERDSVTVLPLSDAVVPAQPVTVLRARPEKPELVSVRVAPEVKAVGVRVQDTTMLPLVEMSADAVPTEPAVMANSVVYGEGPSEILTADGPSGEFPVAAVRLLPVRGDDATQG